MTAERNYSAMSLARVTNSNGNNEKTHCFRGHAFEGANVYWATRANGKPFRQCVACRAVARLERAKVSPEPSREREPSQLRRMVATWLDPEVTGADFDERFSPSASESAELRLKHGPKASWISQSPRHVRTLTFRRAAR